MASLGQELRRERELRAMSLEEIADLTRINLKYLEALENDKLDVLPGTFFVKAVLRAFARCQGIEENDFVNKYHEEIILQQDARDQERRREEYVPFQPKKKRGVLVVLLAAAVFLGLLGAGYVLFLRPSGVNPPVVHRPAAQAAVKSVIPEPILPSEVQAKDRIQEAEIRLELTFTAETWIQVVADGQVLIDGHKGAGQTAACVAKQEFLIRTGNAGGFRYTLNGRPGKPLGAPGEVKTDIRISRDNLAGYLGATETGPAERTSAETQAHG
jgi:cytoskeleton protein RodZ